MLGFALNSGAINTAGVIARYVYLPSSTMTMDAVLSERRFVSLSGGMEIVQSLAGDLSRVANLGDAPQTWSNTYTGTLSRVYNIGNGSVAMGFNPTGTIYTGITFGSQSMSMAYAMSGTIGTVTLIPGGQSDWASTWSGSILRTGGLAGSMDMASTVSGDPRATVHFGSQVIAASYEMSGSPIRTAFLDGSMAMAYGQTGNLYIGQRAAIGVATMGMGASFSGDLRGAFRMPGSVDMALSASGDPFARKLFGYASVDVTINVTGRVAKNIAAQDTPENTMVRQYQERTMVRQ